MNSYAVYPFDFGFLKIEYEENVITGIKTIHEKEPVNATIKESSNAAAGKSSALTDKVYAQICEYLRGKRKTFDFPYELRGTEFQKKVWNVLCSIPYGETRTYKEIAAAVGNPKACRAVGMANNKNPIAIAVPCHRVIGANGSLTGYAGGLNMKKALLLLESGGTI
ncbi:MAG: methylated-DNA--[protein]-cysteine S-methyltransferase [Firmicutes bacterium]|nr:methylated-DNA--[protein]-cysteine S-methyltransferase [Bacillota bacterium]